VIDFSVFRSALSAFFYSCFFYFFRTFFVRMISMDHSGPRHHGRYPATQREGTVIRAAVIRLTPAGPGLIEKSAFDNYVPPSTTRWKSQGRTGVANGFAIDGRRTRSALGMETSGPKG